MTRSMPPGLRSIGFALAAAFAFNAAAPVFADGVLLDFRSALSARAEAAHVDVDATGPIELPPIRSWSPGPAAHPVGPSEAQLRAVFPERSLQRMDPEAFQAFVHAHAGEGRLLSGVELAAALGNQASPARATDPDTPPPPPTVCDSLPSAARMRCRDSLSRAAADTTAPRAAPRALREMQAKEAAARAAQGREAQGSEAQGRETQRRDARDQDSLLNADLNPNNAPSGEQEEAKGWFANLFLDLNERGSKGKGMDGHDWAALIYVVVGVVVVGAFIVYAAQTLVELAINQEHYPLFQEVGLRLSYSGRAWRDGAGTDLYRDAYLAGIRYAVGFDRPGADVGLAVEAGYIDIHLSPLDGPGDAFDFRGGYGIAGPLLRFGSFDPMCFSLEFLNGTSNHPSIGWISKARMALQYRIGKHETVGADLGAVFYDLGFLDGLAWRSGDLNRDLSLIGGLDFGWEF